MNALRQYLGYECGEDGYPFAWHGKCSCDGIPTTEGLDVCIYDVCTGDQAAIKDMIREEAQNRCERCRHPYSKGQGEWSLCDERCLHAGQVRIDGHERVRIYYPPSELWAAWAEDDQPRRVIEAHYRILTVHHLDEDKANCRWWNLVALCQRCHLRMQRAVVMDRPYHYEHSEWFQPYAAGFYAFKYLGEDLSREEVMARLPELLKLEHRFTQGVLL